jgi:hypothetical protein
MEINKQIEINTPEDVIKAMSTDMQTYQEWIFDLALYTLKHNPECFQSWKKWFENAEFL